MGFVRNLVLRLLLIWIGTVAILAQQPSKNASLDETMSWLKDSIAKTAGFSFSRTITAKDATSDKTNVETSKGQLIYQINRNDSCHLGWRAVASGNADLEMQFPVLDVDEDLRTIATNSVKIRPFDLAQFAGAGTQESAEEHITTVVRPSAPGYWKVVAAYSYSPNGNDEQPFGFIFSDREEALRIAASLNHAVDLCHGPDAESIALKPPGSAGSGCATVSDKVTMVTVHGTSANTIGWVPSGSGELYSYTQYTNHAAFAVSCAVHFHRNGVMDTKSLSAFDLAPGQTFDKLPEPAASDMGDAVSPAIAGTLQFRCYVKGSVDESGKACTSHIW